MESFIGMKLIKAKPMARGQYNDYRGWELPENEDGSDQGMLVEYANGGEPNHPGHEGYISWSPLDVFENAYKSTRRLNFSMALEELKAGRKVWRKAWDSKGMWLILVPGTNAVRPVVGTPYSKAGLTEQTDINPHIDMYTAAGNMQPGWLASQPDMLAEDWCSDRVY